MEIKEPHLQLFIELYEREFGVSLTQEKAEEEFSKLCQLYSLLYLKQSDIRPICPCYNTPATRKNNS